MAAKPGSKSLLEALKIANERAAKSGDLVAPIDPWAVARSVFDAPGSAAQGVNNFIGSEAVRLRDNWIGLKDIGAGVGKQTSLSDALASLDTKRGGWARGEISEQRGGLGQIARGLLDASILASMVKPAVGALEKPIRALGRFSGNDNVTGTFGGMMAANADTAALAKAQQMAKAGSPREDIWNQTGWFQGADKKWRFEIDDSAARRMAHPFPSTDKSGPLSEILDHSALYSAYPDLAQTETTLWGSQAPGGGWGAYRKPQSAGLLRKPWPEHIGATSEGVISDSATDIGRTNLLHEVQHAIQAREGFAPGLSPSDPRAIAMAKDQGLTPRDIYRLDAGELEARNVARRRNLTPNQRKQLAPWETEDGQSISQQAVAPPSQLDMGFGGKPGEKPLLSALRDAMRGKKQSPLDQFTPPTSIDDIFTGGEPRGPRELSGGPANPAGLDGSAFNLNTPEVPYDPAKGFGGLDAKFAADKNARTLSEALAKAKREGASDSDLLALLLSYGAASGMGASLWADQAQQQQPGM